MIGLTITHICLTAFLASVLCRRDSLAISDGLSAHLCLCLQSLPVRMCIHCVDMCVL